MGSQGLRGVARAPEGRKGFGGSQGLQGVASELVRVRVRVKGKGKGKGAWRKELLANVEPAPGASGTPESLLA